MKKRSFTFVEILITLTVISILTSIGLTQYKKVTNRAQAATTYSILHRMHLGYEAMILANLYQRGTYQLATGGEWCPGFPSAGGYGCGRYSNADWVVMGLEASPNINPSQFHYRYYTRGDFPCTNGGGNCFPANEDLGVAIKRTPYTTNYNFSKWVAISMVDGEIYKCEDYQ